MISVQLFVGNIGEKILDQKSKNFLLFLFYKLFTVSFHPKNVSLK